VATIGDSAFMFCDRLTGITIGRVVANIERSAFYGCNGLVAFTVDASNQVYSSHEGVLYNKNQDAIIQCPESRTGIVSIPDSVATITDEAFKGCQYLTEITVGTGVSSIGGSAFYACRSLTNITVSPSNQTYSTRGGILYNKNQTTLIKCPQSWEGKLSIPGSVTTIGRGAFSLCYDLEGITIPKSVKVIGTSAFWYCRLDSVFFAGDAPAISSSAFGHSSATLYYLPNTEGWDGLYVGRPIVLWNPTFTALTGDWSKVSCTVTGTADIPIALESSTNLCDWVRVVQTNLTGGTISINDPDSVNGRHRQRYYRIVAP